MGTRGFEIIRFHGRYHVVFHQYDSYPEELGAKIVAEIPTDPQQYNEWLGEQRSIYSEEEELLEDRFLTIRDSSLPKDSELGMLNQLPSALPDVFGYCEEWTYIINLDREVFTVNYGAHFKLNNIPRCDDLWMKALSKSIYRNTTLSTDICPEDCIAGPAVAVQLGDELCQSHIRKFWSLSPRVVKPILFLDHGQVFLGLSFVTLCRQYNKAFTSFALEWSPDDFIFRELAFAIISLASGQVRFHSFPQRDCDPKCCFRWNCPNDHTLSKGRLVIPDSGLGIGGSDILPEFGFDCHRPDEAPGSAPVETMYWFEGVLISLATSICGYGIFEGAITRTVEFGVDQGKEHFQAVIMSLFHLILVEVDVRDGAINIKHTKTIQLSPIRRIDCLSTDPRERPTIKQGEKYRGSKGLAILDSDVAYQSLENLCQYFPGFVSLMAFFDTALNRSAISRSRSRLPPEICCRILEYTDDITHLACAKVSKEFRAYCQQNFRVGQLKIMSGPRSDSVEHGGELRKVMAFTFVNRQTSAVIQLKVLPDMGFGYVHEYNWSPIVGIGRPVILSCVSLYFKPVDDEPNDDEPSDDEPSDDEPSDDEPSDEPNDDEPNDDEPNDDEPSDEPNDDKSAGMALGVDGI